MRERQKERQIQSKKLYRKTKKERKKRERTKKDLDGKKQGMN